MRWIVKNVWHPFISAWQEIRWFGPLISAVVISLAITMFYDLLKKIGGFTGTGLTLVVMIFVIFGVVSLHDFFKRKKKSEVAARIFDKPNPPRYKGLILMVSTLAIAREAVEYHKGVLMYCWLVTTPEMNSQADKLKEELEGQVTGVIIRPIKDKYDTRGCYDLTMDIFLNEALRLGLDPHEVIADITGGTKPMTVAMLLAVLEGKFALEHIPTEFNKATGKPIGPLPPIQISVDLPPWSTDATAEVEGG